MSKRGSVSLNYPRTRVISPSYPTASTQLRANSGDVSPKYPLACFLTQARIDDPILGSRFWKPLERIEAEDASLTSERFQLSRDCREGGTLENTVFDNSTGMILAFNIFEHRENDLDVFRYDNLRTIRLPHLAIVLSWTVLGIVR